MAWHQRVGLGTATLLLTRSAVEGTAITFWATGRAAREALGYAPLYTPEVPCPSARPPFRMASPFPFPLLFPSAVL
jgi:hypothetical protein